jgi:hypothetical protein
LSQRSLWAGRVRLVGECISFEKNFYRFPFTPPLWFAIPVLQVVSEPVMGLSGLQPVYDPKMVYQERGSGPPHFDGKNYQMWQRRVSAFLHGKGQILWDVMENTSYVHLINFLALGSRDMHDANNKAVDYLFHALCRSEFD